MHLFKKTELERFVGPDITLDQLALSQVAGDFVNKGLENNSVFVFPDSTEPETSPFHGWKIGLATGTTLGIVGDGCPAFNVRKNGRMKETEFFGWGLVPNGTATIS